MTPIRTANLAGKRCLVWLLLIAVALMGLTITRQQALGSLHSHIEQGPRLSPMLRTAGFSLSEDWSRRWQQQHVFGHGQLLLGNLGSGALLQSEMDSAAANATRLQDAAEHRHGTLERHHHTEQNTSVIAVNGAAALADAADSPVRGAAGVLLGIGVPGAALAIEAVALRTSPWPLGHFAAMATRSVPPLLRPPSA